MWDMLDFPDKVESDAVPYTPRRTGTVAKLQLNPTTVLYYNKVACGSYFCVVIITGILFFVLGPFRQS